MHDPEYCRTPRIPSPHESSTTACPLVAHHHRPRYITPDIASAALARPPPTSSSRDHRILLAAREAGVSGQALSVLTVRYRPSQALRDLVSVRDFTCTADTCMRPASNSQLDHAVDFDGSNTTLDSVHAVCGPDHLVVTAGHFLIDTDDAGHISWVSTASGHSYPSHPDLLRKQPVKSGE